MRSIMHPQSSVVTHHHPQQRGLHLNNNDNEAEAGAGAVPSPSPSSTPPLTFSTLRSVALVRRARRGGTAASALHPPGADSGTGAGAVSSAATTTSIVSDDGDGPGPGPVGDNNPRSEVLHLGVLAGELCRAVLLHAPPLDSSSPGGDDATTVDREEVGRAMGALLLGILCASAACRLDLARCVLKKVELNGRKYPVELCRGKSGKYTQYSAQTNITKTHGQSTVDDDDEEEDNHIAPAAVDTSLSSWGSSEADDEEEGDWDDIIRTSSSPPRGGTTTNGEGGSSPSPAKSAAAAAALTVGGATALVRSFSEERNWGRYHTPRSLVLALMGELGELAELFQWRGDGEAGESGEAGEGQSGGGGGDGDGLDGWSVEDRDKAGQELADVAIYLMRCADVCGVDLGGAALEVGREDFREHECV